MVRTSGQFYLYEEGVISDDQLDIITDAGDARVALSILRTAARQRLVGAQHAEWTAAVFAFAPTVLPIAVTYEIAHNYPFVLANAGQLVAVLWPFIATGHGPVVDPLTWLSLSAYWRSQVLLIVVGHLVAGIAAHYVAVARYPTVTAARRGTSSLRGNPWCIRITD